MSLSNNQLFVTGLALFSTAAALSYISEKDDVHESFWTVGSFQPLQQSMESSNLSNAMHRPSLKEDFDDSLRTGQVAGYMTLPGTYQSAVSPRMGIPEGLKSYTKLRSPPRSMMAVPKNPLGAQVAKQVENYEPISLAGCSGQPEQANQPALPIGNQNPIVFDRLIFSNKKSKLRGLGDPIRGDLPIVPDLNFTTGWFRPPVRPALDLNTGALGVIGGMQGGEPVAKLALADSGGVSTSQSGVSYQSPINVGNQFVLKGAGVPKAEAVSLTSFP